MIICILCTSGRGTGGLLYNHKMNWFSEEPEPPEECPQCGSSLGLFTLAHDEPAAVAVAAETLLAQREEIERLKTVLTNARANLQHVEHALGERLRPGQTLEQTIADLFADLDRAHHEHVAVCAALGLADEDLPSSMVEQIHRHRTGRAAMIAANEALSAEAGNEPERSS